MTVNGERVRWFWSPERAPYLEKAKAALVKHNLYRDEGAIAEDIAWLLYQADMRARTLERILEEIKRRIDWM